MKIIIVNFFKFCKKDFGQAVWHVSRPGIKLMPPVVKAES